MANRTVKEAQSVKGTNPQYLVEKIIRSRIYESRYWKEQCFALSAELMVDKAMELKYCGGVYSGNVKPTPFICLLLKMLQIQPEKDIVVEFIKNEDFKYVRCLGAIYMRLVGTSLDCYKYLEPLLNDYRKIRMMNRQGEYYLSHIDEFIDDLLHEERSCNIIMPRLQKRQVLEELGQLELRISALEDDLDNIEEESSEDEAGPEAVPSPSPDRRRYHSDRNHGTHSYRRSRSRDRDRRRRSPSPRRHRRDHHRDRSRSRSPRRDRSPDRGRGHRGDPDRDRDRGHRSHRDRDDSRRHRDLDSSKRHKDKSDKDESKHKKSHKKKSKKEKERHKDKKSPSKDQPVDKNQEIAEANALRAKLGLAPLK